MAKFQDRYTIIIIVIIIIIIVVVVVVVVISSANTKRRMPFRGKYAVCFEIHTNYVNTTWEN